MKKRLTGIFALLLAVTLVAGSLAGCNDKKIENSSSSNETSLTTATPATPTTTEPTTVTTTEETTTEETTTEATTTAATTKATTKVTAATTKATAATTKATTVATTKKPAVTTPEVKPAGGVGKYVYNALPTDEKKIYDEIVAAINKFSPSVTFSQAYDGAKVTKIYQTVFFQEPGLFWFKASTSAYSGSTTSIPLDYRYTASQVPDMQKKIDAGIERIRGKFPANANTYQKIKTIHDDIILRTAFSKDSDEAKCIYGPLAGATSQCEGYAKAFNYACNKFGIESVRITGNNDKGLSHAWNKVVVNGKWYNIDLTFDDPEGPASAGKPNFISYRYFLVPDSQINNISNFPITTFTPPVANSLEENFHAKSGIYADSVEKAKTMMQAEMTKAAKTKVPVIQIKCSSKAVFDAAKPAVIGQAMAMKKVTNATAGVTQITGLSDGTQSSDAKGTYVIQINLNY